MYTPPLTAPGSRVFRSSIGLFALLATSFFVAERSAVAGLILQNPGPDIYGSPLSAIYNPTLLGPAFSSYDPKDFLVAGSASQLRLADNSTVQILGPGAFSMVVNAESDGSINSGSFSVEGFLAGSSSTTSVTLLAGTITELELSMIGDGMFDAIAENVSGELADLFVANASESVGLHFTGFGPQTSFVSFMSFNNGNVNIGRPVPEPSSAALFGCLVCLGSCSAIRRRRRRT